MTLLNPSRERAEARSTHPRRCRPVGLLVLTFIGAGAASTARAQRPCDPPTAWGPSRDLYCIELVSAPGMEGVSGRLELGHIPGPFTVAAGADGRLRYQLTLRAIGLPPPEPWPNAAATA